MLEKLPINYNTLMFWGGVAYAIGTIGKINFLSKYGGFGIIAGVVWYLVTDVVGIHI